MKPLTTLLAAFVLTLLALPALGANPPYAFQALPGVSPEPVAGRTGPTSDPRSREELEAFLDGVMNAHLKYTPMAGATLAVVRGSEVLLIKGYGSADLEKGVPVDGEKSLFRPGSTSKLFTWTAVMQLVEQGKLDLDADVNQYIPDFKLPEAFGKPVTLRNLLTHTAGLEDGGLGYLMSKGPEELIPMGQALAAHIPARVRAPTTNFNGDGTNSSYSNWGTALAGHIVASVSGLSFDEYIEKNIFAPLGMGSSTFREPLPAELAPRMATGYVWKNGKPEAHGFEFIHNFGPAGSLTSSAPDMAKFMLAHLNEGALGEGRILKPETARLMHGRQFAPNPHLAGSGLGFYETWINGRRIIGHGGDTVAFHTDLWLLPEEKLGVFVSYNSSNEFAPYNARRDLIRALMDRYYPATLPRITPPADFKQRAAKYSGSYAGLRRSYTKFESVFGLASPGTKVVPTPEGTLMISNLLLPGISYWSEVAPSVFREVDGDDMLAFVEDADGRVTHLVRPFTFIGAYKMPWYEVHELHWFILGFGLICFVVAIASALKNWKTDRAAPAAARRARRLAALLGLVQVTGLLLLVTVIAGDIDTLIYALPKSIYAALTLPLIAVPLTAGVLLYLPRVWKESGWSRYGRVQYSIIVIMGTLFLWSQYYWNVLGYKLG